MKRKYFYLMALSALTLGACSNDDSFGESPDGPQGKQQQVTFLFPGTAQGVVPYADAPIASAEENKIETLDVYVFGADKLATANPRYLLEDVIKIKSDELTGEADALAATFTIVGTNPKCLYFVANGAGQTELNDYELNVTDTLAFVKKQTTSLGKGLLKAPLLMTGRFAIQAAADGTFTPAGPYIINLNRRVARFDIKNDSEESTLAIEKILIRNTRQGAYLFAHADESAAKDGADDFAPYNGPTIAELMEIDFISYPTANIGTTPSVFYVYPTVVNGETSFLLKGYSTQSGEKMVQPVMMRIKQTGTEEETKLLPINANTRYIINVLNAGSAIIDATITVKEWQVGQGVDVEAGFGQVKMTLEAPAEGVEPTAGLSLIDSKLLNVPNDVLAAFGINVAADTEWEIVEQDADLAWIKLTDRPVVDVVGKKFSVEITQKNPSSEVRTAVLHIRNVKRPSIVQTLTVVQAASADGFKVTGDRLENNTLSLFAANSTNILKLALPNGITAFDCETADSWIALKKPVASRAPINIEGTELEVAVTTNNTDAAREGTISITVGTATQIIAVKQAPRNLGSITWKAVGMIGDQLTYEAGEQIGKSLIVRALTGWEVKAVDMVDGVATTTPSAWITNGTFEFKDQGETKATYDGKYNFTLTENTTGAERKSQVTLVNKFDPTIKAVLYITQAAPASVTVAGPNLTDDVMTLDYNYGDPTEEYTITPKGGAVADLTIEASTEFNGFWTLNAASLTTTGKFSLTTTYPNLTASPKTGTFDIKLAGKIVKTITANLIHTTEPVFSISSTDFTVNGTNCALAKKGLTEGILTVSIDIAKALKNVEYAKDGNSTWLTVDVSALQTGKLTLSATENSGTEERLANITLWSPANLDPFTFTVTQAAAASVTVTGPNLTGDNLAMNSYEGTLEYTITPSGVNLSDLTIEQEAGSDAWLTLASSTLTTEGKFTLTATVNHSEEREPRTATLTIKNGDTVLKTIAVTQVYESSGVFYLTVGDDLTNDGPDGLPATTLSKEAHITKDIMLNVDELKMLKAMTHLQTAGTDWLTIDFKTLKTTGKFKLTVTENTGAERVAVVYLDIPQIAGNSIEFTVTQAGI